MLLELRSQQCVVVFQLLNLNNNTEARSTDASPLSDTAVLTCEGNLLPQQLVVHLHPLHLLVALLELLVVLPQLSDVVTGFGQDPSFTLKQPNHRRHSLASDRKLVSCHKRAASEEDGGRCRGRQQAATGQS